jgi:hypothetical protein
MIKREITVNLFDSRILIVLVVHPLYHRGEILAIRVERGCYWFDAPCHTELYGSRTLLTVTRLMGATSTYSPGRALHRSHDVN